MVFVNPFDKLVAEATTGTSRLELELQVQLCLVAIARSKQEMYQELMKQRDVHQLCPQAVHRIASEAADLPVQQELPERLREYLAGMKECLRGQITNVARLRGRIKQLEIHSAAAPAAALS